MFSIISAIPSIAPCSSISIVKSVESLKYSMSVPSKQSKTVKNSLLISGQLRVRCVGQVIDGEDQRFGEMAGCFHVFTGVAGDLFDDLPVTIGRGDFSFN